MKRVRFKALIQHVTRTNVHTHRQAEKESEQATEAHITQHY